MFSLLDNESTTTETQPTAPGQVRFDARGNAVYTFHDDRLSQDGAHADRLRQKALRHSELALVDDVPAALITDTWNDKGLKVGYNPYQSGLLAGEKPATKKTDLRELSKWIEMKRRMDGRAPAAKKTSQAR